MLSKFVAGREKDLAFAVDARRAGMLELDELRRRLSWLDIDERLQAAVAARIEHVVRSN